jgi:hypothetical protein
MTEGQDASGPALWKRVRRLSAGPEAGYAGAGRTGAGNVPPASSPPAGSLAAGSSAAGSPAVSEGTEGAPGSVVTSLKHGGTGWPGPESALPESALPGASESGGRPVGVSPVRAGGLAASRTRRASRAPSRRVPGGRDGTVPGSPRLPSSRHRPEPQRPPRPRHRPARQRRPGDGPPRPDRPSHRRIRPSRGRIRLGRGRVRPSNRRLRPSRAGRRLRAPVRAASGRLARSPLAKRVRPHQQDRPETRGLQIRTTGMSRSPGWMPGSWRPPSSVCGSR